jgi:hypothetical protein
MHALVRLRLLALALVVSSLLATPALAARHVSDPAHGFTLEVPDGFFDAPQAMAPNVLHAYQRGNAAEGSFALVQLQALSGRIGRDKADPAEAEKAARAAAEAQGVALGGFELRNARWKGFDIDLMVVTMGDADTKVVTLAAQVPLANQAVQLQIVGPAADEARLRQELDAFLAGLDGKSSWLSDAERSEKLGTLVGGAVGVLLAVGFALWWSRRKRPTA